MARAPAFLRQNYVLSCRMLVLQARQNGARRSTSDARTCPELYGAVASDANQAAAAASLRLPCYLPDLMRS